MMTERKTEAKKDTQIDNMDGFFFVESNEN